MTAPLPEQGEAMTPTEQGGDEMTTNNTPGQSAKNAHYPEPDYTHPDEMPIVEQRPNPHSDLRGTIVHFTSEMLDNPDNYGIYPTTNFYNDLEEAILDWHNKQVESELKSIYSELGHIKAVRDCIDDRQAERNKLKEGN